MTEIRRCFKDDITKVAEFIDNHWGKGHVMAVSRKLMDWQHKTEDGSYDYLLAWHGQKLVGILGYISSCRFDTNLTDRNVLWLAIWKIREDCRITGLGLKMLNELTGLEPNIGVAINKILPEHELLYSALRYQVVEMKQYYVTDPDKPSRLIMAPSSSVLPVPMRGEARFTEMGEADLLEMPSDYLPSGSTPIKTPLYFLNRFLRHPFYHYRVFRVDHPTDAKALIATRVSHSEDKRALRIVDFSGDLVLIGEIGKPVLNLMNEEHAEYADFWQHGVPHEYLERAGFALAKPDGDVIVPNYFVPFSAKTSRIFSTYKSNIPGRFLIFKADGDQDRPNYLDLEKLI
jgi:hypothetical protein